MSIENTPPDCSKILSRSTMMHSRSILTKTNIELPVLTVFGSPVVSRCCQYGLSGHDTAFNVVMNLRRLPGIYQAVSLDDCKLLESRPVVVGINSLSVVEDPTTPVF